MLGGDVDVVEEIETDFGGVSVSCIGSRVGGEERCTFHAMLCGAGDFAAHDLAPEGPEDEEAEDDCSS